MEYPRGEIIHSLLQNDEIWFLIWHRLGVYGEDDSTGVDELKELVTSQTGREVYFDILGQMCLPEVGNPGCYLWREELFVALETYEMCGIEFKVDELNPMKTLVSVEPGSLERIRNFKSGE